MPTERSTVYIGGAYEKNSDGSVVKYYGALGRTIAMRQVPAGGGAGTLYYLLSDHLGSASTITDDAGAVVSSQKYWPYGATRSGAISQTDKLYTGQQQEPGDSALGLYNYKARFYSTTLGRFVSADSVGDGLNRYAYVHGNPVNFVDPSGHSQTCGLHSCCGVTCWETLQSMKHNWDVFRWNMAVLGYEVLPFEAGAALFGNGSSVYAKGATPIAILGGGFLLAAESYLLAYDTVDVLSGNYGDPRSFAKTGVVTVNANTRVFDLNREAWTDVAAAASLVSAISYHYTSAQAATEIARENVLRKGPDDPGGQEVFYSKVLFASEAQAKQSLGIDEARAAVAFVPVDPVYDVRFAQRNGKLIPGGPLEFVGISPYRIVTEFVMMLLP